MHTWATILFHQTRRRQPIVPLRLTQCPLKCVRITARVANIFRSLKVCWSKDHDEGKLTSKADACACGPPVSSGTPTHNPPRSLACSGNDAESCGAPGSAIVYNLQGASGVTINSNSGNNISDSGNDNNSNNGNDSGNDSDDDNGNDSGQSNGTKPNNGSISSSSFGGTPSSSVGGTSNSSLGANPTSSIGGTGTAGPPPFPGGPPPAGRSGPAKIPPDSTSSAAAAGTSGTKPIPQDEPCLQGDYHIPIKTEASCPGDDFSKATDPYTEATVYNISCRTTLGGDSLPPVHADNFDACLHFCDTYRTCIGVSYVNATGPQSANCVAYRSFMGCQTAATPSSNYIAAAAANGSNYANNYQSDNALCRNATYKTVPYTDPETRYQYKISCGYIYGNTTNLPAAAMDSFRGCVAYCAAQAACVGVLYEGSGPTDGGATNCYPYSSASGSLLKYYSFSVAVS